MIGLTGLDNVPLKDFFDMYNGNWRRLWERAAPTLRSVGVEVRESPESDIDFQRVVWEAGLLH
jgi:hypothetical protein